MSLVLSLWTTRAKEKHKETFEFEEEKTREIMCKEASRWESLKRGITLHLSMILEKVDLLNFFFLSLSGKA